MKTILKSSGILIAACVACCAPLLIAPAIAAAAALGISMTLFDTYAVAIMALTATLAFGIWRMMKKAKLIPTKTSGKCGCKTDSGCNSSSACDV